MKIDVQEELKRFKLSGHREADLSGADPSVTVTAIMSQFRDLKKADLKIIGEVQRLAEEVKNLIKREGPVGHPSPDPAEAKQNQVLFAIYDQVDTLLKVAQANQNPIQVVVYRQLLEYISTLFAIELDWVLIKSVGERYNPYEYDGFAMEDRAPNPDGLPRKLEIVTELRAGFRRRGQVIRKPMVEFYE